MCPMLLGTSKNLKTLQCWYNKAYQNQRDLTDPPCLATPLKTICFPTISAASVDSFPKLGHFGTHSR